MKSFNGPKKSKTMRLQASLNLSFTWTQAPY